MPASCFGVKILCASMPEFGASDLGVLEVSKVENGGKMGVLFSIA